MCFFLLRSGTCEKSDGSSLTDQESLPHLFVLVCILPVVPEPFHVSYPLFLSSSARCCDSVCSSVHKGCWDTCCFSLKIAFLDASDRFLLQCWWKLAIRGLPLATQPPVWRILSLLGRRGVRHDALLCRHALVPRALGLGSGLAFSLVLSPL